MLHEKRKKKVSLNGAKAEMKFYIFAIFTLNKYKFLNPTNYRAIEMPNVTIVCENSLINHRKTM